ncbi:MAG: hypothetical protein ABJH05_11630 [Fulvivirga sp.]
MKNSLVIILCLLSVSSFSQKQINVSQSTAGVKSVVMDFKYPELIVITTWDKDEIVISGKSNINNGENDEAFKLNIEKEGDQLTIRSEIENLEDLPKRIMIKRNGEKYYFDTDDFHDPKIKAFLEEKGGGHQYQMHGVIKEITLEIKVPKTIFLDVRAKYGLVEIKNVLNALVVDAKYGGIDISLQTNSPRDIVAKTKHGEMFSDLDMQINPKESEHNQYYKWTSISAKLSGGGPKCSLESKYGNIYIRKL